MDAGAAKPAGGGAPTTQSLDASQHPSKRCKGADGTAMKAEAVADHYSNRANQSYQERMRSPILHLRLLNNWVKSCLILKYVKPDDRVFDLAMGKGGDLPKWKRARIGSYFGADIARDSVQEHARTRYNQGGYAFPAKLMVVDAFQYCSLGETHPGPCSLPPGPTARCAVGRQTDLVPHLKDAGTFDTLSCQFAFHYCFASEARARCALRNVAAILRPGGHFIGTTPDANVLVKQLRNVDGLRFGNDVYSVEFNSRHRDKAFPGTHPFGVEYTFTLKDAVDGVPEYLVPFDTLLALAKEEGLQLVYRANFHDFVKLMTTDEEAMQLARQSKVFGDGLRESTFTPPEWEAARLYCVFAFQKEGTPTEKAKAILRRPAAEAARTVEAHEVLVP